MLLSLSLVFLFGVTSSQAKTSCLVCPNAVTVNVQNDPELNLAGCTLEESAICSLVLRVDYTNSNETFLSIGGSNITMLILSNGEPQTTEVTSIWFTELRVQRMINIVCFAGTSCGVDKLKDIYKNQIFKFDYQGIQNKLVEQLYLSSAPPPDLTCVDPSGGSVSCGDGFCESVLDENGFFSYGNCVRKGPVANPYGIMISKAAKIDLNGEQGAIIYTCNKPMCNSKDNAQQVRQQLVTAGLIPQAVTTTASPYSGGSKNESNALLFFLFTFSIFTYFY